MRKVAIYAQSVVKKDLARIELGRLKKAARDTSSLQDAKSKLEKEAKKLAMQLQEEERMRAIMESTVKELEVQLAGMEEAKNKENAKLQSAIKEMEAQLADVEEAKTKENGRLQSAIKEMEVALAGMEEAKNKEIGNLQSAIQETEVQLETKNKENAKLKSAIEEMEVQFQETKELLEAAKKEMEQVLVADNEKIETITTDNEKLKDMVNSLEQEIGETQKKYEETSKLSEERLKQAMDGESKIIDLKLDMQSLQEKIADMEAEDQILRQKERQSGSPSKKFDINLTQSTIGRERELVDTLMEAATEDLGFSQGKPVATYVIYKSLLHNKAFEAEITTIFDRIIYLMGSAIEKKEDIKHMAYWLSVTSTLLFLIQRTLSPSPPKPPPPTSLFGRMTQGFRSASIISIVHHVEAKYPAVLFKKQLATYVEKLYGSIRNNLKKDLSQLLSSCIQAPITSDGKSFPAEYWDSIIERLNDLLDTLKECQVPSVIIQKIFSQAFSSINVQLFNSICQLEECCTFPNGEYVKAGLAKLELWCSKATIEYADSSSDELNHARQAVGFLVIEEKSKLSYDELTIKLCPDLSSQQLHKLSSLNSQHSDDNHSVSPEVISKIKVLMSQDSTDSDSDSYLLDANSSMAFPVDEISKSLNEKDFSSIQPANELLENPEFQFLLE